ncbi:MAG TPA: WhiB family transcriptional regulator [Actinomycetota bacterium]|nr:WhiB family transcriptional regulator [Actinomycetota bacterium]
MASNEDWQESGACRDVPVHLFFPPAEHEGDEAKAICAACEVRQTCLEFALAADERFGVWGGLNPQERRSLLARRRSRARVEAGQVPTVL